MHQINDHIIVAHISSPCRPSPFNLSVHWRLSFKQADRYRVLLQSDLMCFSLNAGLCKHGYIDIERGGAGGAGGQTGAFHKRDISLPTRFSHGHIPTGGNRANVVFRSSWLRISDSFLWLIRAVASSMLKRAIALCRRHSAGQRA